MEAPFFFQSAWFVHAEGTEVYIRDRADISSARDDWDAVMTAASTCVRVSKARMVPVSVHGFFRRTDAMECHGVGVFLFVIVTDDLTLQMASSRSPGASGFGGGPQPRHCQADGKELVFFNL